MNDENAATLGQLGIGSVYDLAFPPKESHADVANPNDESFFNLSQTVAETGEKEPTTALPLNNDVPFFSDEPTLPPTTPFEAHPESEMTLDDTHLPRIVEVPNEAQEKEQQEQQQPGRLRKSVSFRASDAVFPMESTRTVLDSDEWRIAKEEEDMRDGFDLKEDEFEAEETRDETTLADVPYDFDQLQQQEQQGPTAMLAPAKSQKELAQSAKAELNHELQSVEPSERSSASDEALLEKCMLFRFSLVSFLFHHFCSNWS
jgi:hypothetical protein